MKKKTNRSANQFGCYMADLPESYEGRNMCCDECMCRISASEYLRGLKEGIGERSYISPSQQIKIKKLEKMQSMECKSKK